MFGWELPPYNSGGLGTACLGLSKELTPLGVGLDFVVPQMTGELPYNHMNILDASTYTPSEEIEKMLKIDALTQQQISTTPGYISQSVEVNTTHTPASEHLSRELYSAQEHYQYLANRPFTPEQQARWYSYQAPTIAEETNPDLVHCHEWMTFDCGIAARKTAKRHGKNIPFVAQVHATEIDRGGAHGHKAIMEIEKRGLHAADRVVAVSHYTKQIIHQYYEVPNSKISVVHNGISLKKKELSHNDLQSLKKHYKLVLFMGRVTMSKGPEYFVRLAKAVTDRDPKIKFIMVGSGDMEHKCIELAAQMGLTGKILFSPFLRGADVDRAYQLADLFIMPSVSEPFGLVALEAMQNGIPTIISKQSGVAEVSKNLVAIDFWDTKLMQKAVLELLYSPHIAEDLSANGLADLQHITWANSAGNMKQIYTDLLTSFVSKPALHHA